jgi:hypothetical protein
MFAFAGALFVGQADAAVKLSDVFDGNYFSPDANGRGVSILYAPNADGSGTFFGVLFTYDENNEPTWLFLQQNDWLEHQFESDEVPIYRVTGGVFGPGYDNAAITIDTVGTATVRVNSCSSIFFDLDMDDDSGFEDFELGDLQPVDGPAETCAYREEFASCPSFSTPFGAIPRACQLSGAILNQDITLTNDTTWVLSGLVRIGDDNANSSTITIEPGTVLIGEGVAADYLYISPGSKIIANGTPWAPIVMTSPQDGFDAEFNDPQPGDVGGLVVSGNAPNNACPEAPFDCRSEFDETLRYGGDDPNDSSGEISYWQVRYAGYIFAPNREVNSFTFQSAGAGTTVHHLQAFRGQDDGVEFFGGTVNVSYMVVTEGGDDAVDWDQGYSGNLQYGLVVNGEGFGEDFGIEGASNGDNFDLLPRATPTLANYTFLGGGNGDSGILFKEGSGGLIFNTIVSGYPTGCIEWDDAPATYDAAGTPEAPNATVSAFNGVIIHCEIDFVDADGAPYSVGDYFGSASFSGNEDTDPMLDGFMPMADSPALTDSVNVTEVTGNQYFDYTSYRGGFSGTNDWTAFWTHQVTGGSN